MLRNINISRNSANTLQPSVAVQGGGGEVQHLAGSPKPGDAVWHPASGSRDEAVSARSFVHRPEEAVHCARQHPGEGWPGIGPPPPPPNIAYSPSIQFPLLARPSHPPTSIPRSLLGRSVQSAVANAGPLAYPAGTLC